MMRIFCTVCLLLLFLLPARAQLVQTKIDRYPVPADQPFESVVVLKMPYAGYTVESVYGDTLSLIQAGALIIDVVCTDYPTEQTLARLNNNRLKTLYQRYPFLRHHPSLQVNCYRQTAGTEKERATELFHGIVLRYRKRQDSISRVDELRMLDSLLTLPFRQPLPPAVPALRGDDLPATPSKEVLLPMVSDSSGKVPYYDPTMSLQGKRVTHIIGDTAYLRKKFRLPDDAVLLDCKTAYRKKRIRKTLYQRLKNQPNTWLTLYQPLEERLPEQPALIVPDTAFLVTPVPLPDSTLLRVFSRNHWDNPVFVCDVTGSMYPYTTQLLQWLRLQMAGRKAVRLLCFNDGDDRDDDKKRPGKTGGIYMQQCTRFEEAEALVKLTMQKGAGGDFPENTAEALYVARQRFPDARDLVLIADNWADIRDSFLLKHIRVPVHVILCGSHENDIRPVYLQLARLTGGSVHTPEADITRLQELKEGEILTIGQRRYVLQEGRFVPLEENNP